MTEVGTGRPVAGSRWSGLVGSKWGVGEEPGGAVGVPEIERGGVGGGALAGGVLGEAAVDHPAHDAADEDGEGGGDREVGADGEGERADAEELDGEDERDAEQDERPGEAMGEDAVDDGGHETALRGGGFFAADALDPLDLDALGGGVVEVLAVFEGGGADGVEDEEGAGVWQLGAAVGGV